MRNTGWYIPYWRKPKKKGKSPASGDENVARTDEQLEGVRQRWVERYRRTVRALAVFGLSVGSNRSEVQARYERVRGTGVAPERELEDAYRYLLRVLPPVERRRKRSSSGNRGDKSEPTQQSAEPTVVVEETAVLIAVEVTSEAGAADSAASDDEYDSEDEDRDTDAAEQPDRA